MSRKKIKCLCFYAEWDSNMKLKQEQMCTAAKSNGMSFELINVDDNVGLTIKYGIRNVPAIVVLDDKEVVAIERGNDGYKKINKYARRTR